MPKEGSSASTARANKTALWVRATLKRPAMATAAAVSAARRVSKVAMREAASCNAARSACSCPCASSMVLRSPPCFFMTRCRASMRSSTCNSRRGSSSTSPWRASERATSSSSTTASSRAASSPCRLGSSRTALFKAACACCARVNTSCSPSDSRVRASASASRNLPAFIKRRRSASRVTSSPARGARASISSR